MAEMLWLYITYEGLKPDNNSGVSSSAEDIMLYITYEGLKHFKD